MAYEFQKLSEVEALTEVPEGANALIEVNGDIKRVPGSGLGGGKTLVIIGSDFTNDSVQERLAGPVVTYTANMTFDEAMEAFYNCELTSGVLYTYSDNNGPVMATMFGIFDDSINLGTTCLVMTSPLEGELFWTADGISTEQPGGVPK